MELGYWSFPGFWRLVIGVFAAMNDHLLEELLRARQTRTLCALATVAATTGSVPRRTGSKMLVYNDGKISGTIGGGIGAASGASVALVAVSDDVSWDFVSDFAFFDDDTFGDSGCSDVVAGTLPLAGAE